MEHPDLSPAINTYRKNPSVWTDCLGKWKISFNLFLWFLCIWVASFASPSMPKDLQEQKWICKVFHVSLNLHISDRIDAVLFSQAYWAPQHLQCNLLCIQTYLCFQPLCHVLYETVPRNLLDLFPGCSKCVRSYHKPTTVHLATPHAQDSSPNSQVSSLFCSQVRQLRQLRRSTESRLQRKRGLKRSESVYVFVWFCVSVCVSSCGFSYFGISQELCHCSAKDTHNEDIL